MNQLNIKQVVIKINEYIEKSKPWDLAKNDTKKLEEVLIKARNDLYNISCEIETFLSETAKK